MVTICKTIVYNAIRPPRQPAVGLTQGHKLPALLVVQSFRFSRRRLRKSAYATNHNELPTISGQLGVLRALGVSILFGCGHPPRYGFRGPCLCRKQLKCRARTLKSPSQPLKFPSQVLKSAQLKHSFWPTLTQQHLTTKSREIFIKLEHSLRRPTRPDQDIGVSRPILRTKGIAMSPLTALVSRLLPGNARSRGSCLVALAVALTTLASAFADDLPIVRGVEAQPLKAQAKRVAEALDFLGEPLTKDQQAALDKALATPTTTRRSRRFRKCSTHAAWPA